MKKKKYTKEQLIVFLKKQYHKIKKVPTISSINKDKKSPSASTYQNRFGSWNNALKKAGLNPNIKTTFTKKEMIQNLIQLSKELGRIPKAKDLKEKNWIQSYSTYKKYFGSWNNALKKAKLTSFDDLKIFIKR